MPSCPPIDIDIMRIDHLTSRVLPALLVAALAIPVAGPVGAQEPVPADQVPTEPDDDREVADVGAPFRPFPEVPGVDLGSLGYVGVPLDAGSLDRLTSPLPDEPRHRVMEIGLRLEEIPPLLEGLQAARPLLARVVADLDPRVAELRVARSVAEELHLEATVRADEADRRLVLRTRALEGHRKQMAEVAVAAYVSPPDADVLGAVLGGVATTNEDLTAGVLFEAKADHDGVVEDELEVSIAVAGERREQAVAAVGTSRSRVDEVAAALASAEARRDAHRQALQSVEAMIATLEPALPGLRADRDATIERAWGAIGDLAGISVVDVPVVTVEGIRIHAALAARLQALLDAAHEAGVPLDGWGYRSTEQQIALRRAHCGAAPEDVYFKPAGACSPPTAQPGTSMHERGLAVDFHLAGRSITSHDNPGYQWLAANAAIFGFQNLPSEPWHWSVNGQ